jgi:uncharacterized protein (DUF934 family)
MPPLLDASPSPRPRHAEGVLSARREGRGEGRHKAPTFPASAAHPDPLPTEEWGEGIDGPIWKDGAFQRDTWVRVADGEPLTDAPSIISKKRWLVERESLSVRNAPLGLLLAAGEKIDDIAADLAHFALIALDFPKFSDGRAFSTARLLRDKHGYKGELRAVGNVLADQVPFMRRVGFDSFEVTHAPTRRALLEGRLAEVTLYYQPAGTTDAPAGTRPWLRRSAD